MVRNILHVSENNKAVHYLANGQRAKAQRVKRVWRRPLHLASECSLRVHVTTFELSNL